jgi:hypothetical protein
VAELVAVLLYFRGESPGVVQPPCSSQALQRLASIWGQQQCCVDASPGQPLTIAARKEAGLALLRLQLRFQMQKLLLILLLLCLYCPAVKIGTAKENLLMLKVFNSVQAVATGTVRQPLQCFSYGGHQSCRR